MSVKRSELSVERSRSTATPAVDLDNPWLGLASFSEETRAFFHGRDQEVTELQRRVQRKRLTILFGQSGHGKTSLLRAGLVPRLRPEGYCPVYIRLDHTPGSMSLSEQIKEAVVRATAEAGTWTKPGAAVAGESLWEFLHHRDDLLKDASGRTLVPLIIFDQFEEIFTLAQTDATGRARAEAFVTDLADLVENRPPAALEEKLEQDPAGADRFDFDRADYRILISLREDYLPHLEGLKARMPSVTQNRVRLARLTGRQALESVLKTGGKLVTEEVAAAIVLFISGASDVAHAEVEPSLLSLVCRELNESRLARGHATITADLLEGSRETILAEYYERTLADVPPGVRRYIEDHLLTDSGFRESVAEERVKKAFAAEGAAPDTLAALVNHRLLRIEERLDVRRVEITHDVLCGVVKSSRETRQQRAAQRRARRLRWAVAGLACGLVAVVAGSLTVAVRSRRAQHAAAQRASRTDFTYGSQYIEDGRVSEGLAYLARAARTDPLNYAVGSRLISALTSRPFSPPVGLTYAPAGSTIILGFSNDGSRVVTASDDDTLSFWDVSGGKRVAGPVRLESQRLFFAVDSERNRVAVSLVDGTVHLWEITTGRHILGPLHLGSSPLALRFSPDGRWLAGGSQTEGNTVAAVKVWDASSGELRASWPMRAWVSSLDFSADSSRLLATDFRRYWGVWAIPSGQLLTPSSQFSEVDGQANFGRFSPDGRLVVITDMSGGQMWDWAAQRKVGQRISHDARSDYAEFSADGTLLVTSQERTTRVWKVPSGLLVRNIDFGNNDGRSFGTRLSRDGRRLLFVDQATGTVHLVDTTSGQSLIEPLRSSFFTSARFSPDEQEIWTSSRDGLVRRWRAIASASAPLEIHLGEAMSGRFQTTGPRQLVLSLRERLESRDLETGGSLVPSVKFPVRYRDWMLSPDIRFAAVLTAQGTAELWDLRQPEAVVRHRLANPSAYAPAASLFAFSIDSSKLCEVDPDEKVARVWETSSGRLLTEIHTSDPLPYGGSRLAFDPAGQRFATSDSGGNVGVFDVASGKQLGETVRQGKQINAVTFTPDGRRVASTGISATVHLTDAATGRDVLPPVKLPDSGGRFLWFSENGRFITVRTPRVRQIHFWDTQTGALRSIPLPDGNITSDGELERFDPSVGRIAIASQEDGTVRVWSAATGQILAEPIRADGPITGAVDFSPDGRFIVTQLNGRSTIDIWPVPKLDTSAPVPGWMPRLATAVAGGKINEAGEFEGAPADPGEFAALKAELAALPDNSPYVKWGRWFLSDPATRTISPESPLTAAEARKLADTDSFASLKAKESILSGQENWVDAEVAERDLLVRLRESEGPASASITRQLANLARSLNGQGRYGEAEPQAREALRIWQSLAVKNEELAVAAYLALGESLAGQSRNDEAETALLASFAAYQSTGYVPIVVRQTVTALTKFYDNAKQPEKAALWRARANGNVDIGPSR